MRSINIIKQAIEKAAQELEILANELKSLDTVNRDKCQDALTSLRKAAKRIESEVHELLLDLELGRFP